MELFGKELGSILNISCAAFCQMIYLDTISIELSCCSNVCVLDWMGWNGGGEALPRVHCTLGQQGEGGTSAKPF